MCLSETAYCFQLIADYFLADAVKTASDHFPSLSSTVGDYSGDSDLLSLFDFCRLFFKNERQEYSLIYSKYKDCKELPVDAPVVCGLEGMEKLFI